MYICVTHVDAITKLPVEMAPLSNGPTFPEIKGLKILWWNQSEWPTDKPLFYGTCDDDADLDILGVIGSLTEDEFKTKRESERELQSYNARNERNARIFLAQNELNKALRLERMGLPHTDIAIIDTYIQALADVPSQEGFPFEIIWPTLDEIIV
jgi:hypothetical protein